MNRTSFLTAEDGTQIWYGTVGKGPAVVLCDGLACDGFIWPYLIDDLFDQYTVVRWHYRGHGRSDNPQDLSTLNIQQLARDLRAVLDALEIESAVLAGHSLGVQVILEYYALDPARVRGLIPICGNYKRPLDTLFNTNLSLHLLPYIRKLVEHSPQAAQQFWKAVVPSKISYLLTTAAAVNTRLARGTDFLPYLDHVADMDLRVFLSLLSAAAEHSAEHILPTVAVPTLIIASENDEMTPLFRSEEMAERIPRSKLLVLPQGTHVGPIELPEMLDEAVLEFLGSLVRGGEPVHAHQWA